MFFLFNFRQMLLAPCAKRLEVDVGGWDAAEVQAFRFRFLAHRRIQLEELVLSVSGYCHELLDFMRRQSGLRFLQVQDNGDDANR